MNKYIANLIELGAIVGGREKIVDGFTVFERLPKEQLKDVPEEELLFATMAMGRAVFAINADGTITNYKGVDSHLSNEESASKSLVKVDAAYSSKAGEDYVTSNYPVNLCMFLDHGTDVRIRGASPLEDIEIEYDINTRMQRKGIKLPKILTVREFSQEFSEQFGLPIWIDGSFEDFTAKYREENDKRKQRLKLIHGDSYFEENIPGKRPETLGEYFRRIDIQNDPNIKKFLEEKGVSFESFISYVDKEYALGQRYGQSIRILESPFRIADIEYYKNQGNIDVLNNIIAFTESVYPDRVPFENYFAVQMGTNLANMMNHAWSCNNFAHRQDYTLAGEMCDDSYDFVPEELKAAHMKYISEPEKEQGVKSNIRLKFFLQTYLLSSNIKVLQEEMALRGKSEEEIQSVLSDFLDSFTQNVDLERVSSMLTDGKSKDIAKQAFEILIRTPKDMQRLLAFKPVGFKENETDIEHYLRSQNPGVYFAHRDSNNFFDRVSQGLAERFGIERTFINENEQHESGIDPYSFLEDR